MYWTPFLLWAVVALRTVVFREVTRSAVWMMLPYLAWLTSQ
ncbi:MAG: tryptophan-rich sensory protein [Terracidiphilus sp.]